MKNIKKLKFLVVIAIVVGFVWFLVISPMKTFHSNEKKLEDAARRYFELHEDALPTGERVKTVTLQYLFHNSYIKEDIFVPYTNKVCSLTDSWVKVRKENGEYKYYTYLECGVLSSNVDHKGPEIQLNGKDNIMVGLGEEFKDPGVQSVIDDHDGKLEITNVHIDGKVDTNTIGSYEIKYTAYDQFSNKQTVVRTVNVVQKLNSTIKRLLNGADNFTGDPKNNYIRLSNMLFRVYGFDAKDNVIVVAEEDVANVNYSKLDKWLDYYYDHLMDSSKELLVKAKYCNMAVTDTTLDTVQCNSYTKERYVYIPSIVEVNKANLNKDNYMKPNTMSWIANKKNGTKQAYLVRKYFFYDKAGMNAISYDVTDNYGVRPMMTIKGDTLILNGSGTRQDPYVFGDSKKARGGDSLNKRYTGEYIYDMGTLWRIIQVEKDGTTKAVTNGNLFNYEKDNQFRNLQVSPAAKDGLIYNPKNSHSFAYFVNNGATGYVDTSKFVNHTIQVPIYKKNIVYGEEVETKEYKVVLSAPNLYEMFSAQPDDHDADQIRSYWLLNSSKSNHISFVTDIGVPYTGEYDFSQSYGLRVVAFFHKNVTVINGSGTYYDPYKITK